MLLQDVLGVQRQRRSRMTVPLVIDGAHGRSPPLKQVAYCVETKLCHKVAAGMQSKHWRMYSRLPCMHVALICWRTLLEL